MIFLAGLLLGTFLGVSIMCLMQVKRVNENAMWIELGKAIEWSRVNYVRWVTSYDDKPTHVGNHDIVQLLDAYRDRETKQEKENNNAKYNG